MIKKQKKNKWCKCQTGKNSGVYCDECFEKLGNKKGGKK